MIDPSDDDANRERVMRIIQARCPELGPADLALIGTIQPAAPSAEPDLPIEIGRDIMAVLDSMIERLDDLADAVGVNKDEDDDDTTRRRAG